MADTPYTACLARAHVPVGGLSRITLTAFAALTSALRDAVLREEGLDGPDDDGGAGAGVNRVRAEDAAVSAWCRVESAAARFARSHARAAGGAGLLAETAERVLALLTLDGMEERGHLFEMVGDTMLVRTRVPEGSQACVLIGDLLPWMYRAAIRQAMLLPDPDPDGLWHAPEAEPSWRGAAPGVRMLSADEIHEAPGPHPI